MLMDRGRSKNEHAASSCFVFHVRIAGIPAVITTPYPSTERFFERYRTEATEPDAYAVAITAAQICEKRAIFEKDADRSAGELSDPEIERMLIHSALSEYLIRRDILLLHGSAVCVDDRCYIFTARSGVGKSTHARLWREMFGERCRMINDDKPYLICREEGITVCGSPWNGKHRLGSDTSAPLKAIAILHRGETNRIERIHPADAFGMLYQQAYRPEDGEGRRAVLKLLERVTRNAEFYDLYCNMEKDAAVISYEGMCRT